MRFSPLTDRIAGRGVGTWETHIEARQLIESGADVILLTVGNPDQTPRRYDGRGDHRRVARRPHALRADHRLSEAARGDRGAVARRTGRPAAPTMSRSCRARRAGSTRPCNASPGAGDEIILPEPIYATYEGVVGASGARDGDGAARPRARLSPRPRRDRRRRSRRARGSSGSTRRTIPPARSSPPPRWRRSPRCAARTICGCCRTRSTRTSPSPGRMSAPGRCPTWRSARSWCRACRNRTPRRPSGSAG